MSVGQARQGEAPPLGLLYHDAEGLAHKLQAVATRIYGAEGIDFEPAAFRQLEEITALGHGGLPVCIAKTQYSFSSDPKRLGAPQGHRLRVRELRLHAGAEFVTAICGDIMTMPGLPKVPSAEKIDLIDGKVVGLF